MMPTPADAPYRKVTLNLYEADCAILEKQYGRGWSATVRDWVNQHAQGLPRRIALKDLADHYNGTHAYPDEN